MRSRLLHIVLENLFENARKFSRPRSIARIEFGRTTHEGVPVFLVRDNRVGSERAAAPCAPFFFTLPDPSRTAP